MKVQDIYHFFQEPPPVYLGKELAVCYVLSVLVETGDSYGTALIEYIEANYSIYRLSDTVLYTALKFLEDENVIDGYWQRVEGRGRPRRMYQIQTGKLELARQLGQLWHEHVNPSLAGQPKKRRQSG
ncbi:MAG: PadR family transcriptional regulator [Thermosynechococcaceae cyanobacterium]